MVNFGGPAARLTKTSGGRWRVAVPNMLDHHLVSWLVLEDEMDLAESARIAAAWSHRRWDREQARLPAELLLRANELLSKDEILAEQA